MRKFLSILILTGLVQFQLWGQCGAGETQVVFEIDSLGNYPEEISWKLIEEGTETEVYAREAGFLTSDVVRDTLCLLNNSTYRFEAYDSYGDGWNGNEYTIFYTDGFILKSGMPDNGQGGEVQTQLEESYSFTVGERPGDDCSLPAVLKVNETLGVNTAFYSNSYVFDSLFDSGREAIFQFTPEITDNYLISLADIPVLNRGSLQLFNNCYDAAPTRISFDSTGLVNNLLEIVEPLSAGITYYVVVSNNIESGTDQIQGNLNISYSGDPINTTCAEAFNLAIDGSPVSSRLYSPIPAQSPLFSLTATDSTVYESFAGPLTYSFTLASQQDIVIQIDGYDEFQPSYIELLKQETCVDAPEATYKRVITEGSTRVFAMDGLLAGTYKLNIYIPSFAGNDIFQVSAKTFASMNTAPNQDCASAVASNVIPSSGSFNPSDIQWISLFNANDSGIPAPCGQDSIFTAGTPDLWLKAQVPSSKNLVVQTFGELYDVFTAGDKAVETRFSIYSGTCGNLSEIYCSDKYENHQKDTIGNLNAGEEIFIRLWDKNGDDPGEIGVLLSDPGSLPQPQTDFEMFSDSLSINFQFFSEAFIFDYNVKVSADSFATFLPSYNPASVTSDIGQLGVSGLDPATTYYLQLWSSKEGLTNSDTSIVQVETAPLVINSIANGDWSDPNIWQNGTVPAADSAVNIYHQVSINQGESFNIKNVNIVGAFEEQPNVGLWINNANLDVDKDIRVEHYSGIPTDSVGIFMFTDGANSSTLDVGRNLIFELFEPTVDEPIQFLAHNNGDSLKINVGNEFSFRHSASDTTLFTGNNIDFRSVDFSVGTNLFFFNDNVNSAQPFNAVFRDSRITADVFDLNAFENTNGRFQVNFTGTTEVNVNFNFRRPGNGGKIDFADQSTLRFNGLDYQEITGFGDLQDSIIYNNVIVDIVEDPNSDRRKPVLEILPSYEESFTKVLIEGNLSLMRGLLYANNEVYNFGYEEVVFGENATVTGANSNSYINGVASKIGNSPFVFPVGHEAGLREIQILNNEEFQPSDLVRVYSYNNFCGLADSLLVSSSLARERTEEYWEITSILSDSSVAATFEPVIFSPATEGITDFTSLELINFYNGSSLGNGSSTDSSFQSAIQYDFSAADTARFGLASNSIDQNPFYYQKEIASLSQYALSAGENLIINYSGPFASASDQVYIGGKLATNVSNTDSSLTVTVPEGARSGNIEMIYESNKILYARDQFTVSYGSGLMLAASNYETLTLLENVNGTVSLGQTKMELGLINNDATFDAMIVSPDYQAVTVVDNLSGTTSLREFNVFNEGSLVNPIDFKLNLSNLTGEIGLDAIFEFDVNGDNGLLYFANDGSGNYIQYGEGEADGQTIFKDYLIFDTDFNGLSDALISAVDVSSSSSILNGESGGGMSDCSPYVNSILPIFEPQGKELNQIVKGNFIDNGFSDVAYLINNESALGLIDIYNQDTINYYSNNSRTADQLFEIKKISLFNNGFDQIVASNQSTNEIEIYSFNNGTQSFDISTVPLSFTPAKMDAEDVNGDGFQDLIVSDQYAASLSVLLNDGTGILTEDLSIPYAGGVIADFDVLDLNNDGFKDLLILQEGGQLSVAYYELLNVIPPTINASNITTSSFDLAWDSVANVAAYEIFISLENDTIADLATDSTFILSDTALSFDAPLPFESFYVFGRSISVVGDTSIYSMSLNVNLQTLDSLSFQSQNITHNSFDLSWNSVENVASFEILISLRDSLNAGLDTDSVFLLSDTAISFNAPVDFEEYFVFGRAISAQGDSAAFGSSFKVQLENIQVPEPVISNINSNGFDLSWPAVAGANEYQVYVGLNNDTASLSENDSLFVVSTESISYQAPEYSELYYYFVRSISSSGDTSAFSPEDSVKLPVSSYLEQDSLAVVALYENTNGVNWTNAQNWLTGKLNTWAGLEMTNDSLKAINLSSNQLDGLIPDEVGGLNFVNEIDLSNNSIIDISALTPLIGSLNLLDVSGNELSFEQLEPFISIPAFTYGNQNFEYGLPEEYFEFLGSDLSILIFAPASANTFQWYKDSVQIEGETDSALVFNNLQRADEGLYYVEVNNGLLADLTLSSTVVELKVSSLQRDVQALRQFYDSTNGEGWSSIAWDTSSDNPTEWSANEQDIIVEDNRVVEINLPENNLTGSVPAILNEVLGLRTINLSNNAIENLANLTTLPNLALLDVSGNALDYDDLIPNLPIDGFIFTEQANFGNLEDQRLPQGSGFSIEYEVEGENNTYQWFLNDEPINISDSSSISVDSLTYNWMGDYTLEVGNSLINAVDPDFRLVSNPVQIIAISDISGVVADANNFPTESGNVYLFKHQEGQAFDSVLLDNGEFFMNLQAEGVFELQNVELGDYVIYVNNDESNYPNLLNTYYPNSIDWELAEVITFRSSIEGLRITMEGEPEELNGTSNLSGYLEEEYEEGERMLPRRRVSKAGVSVRTLSGSSRDLSLKSILQFEELVAYLETDENGEFAIPNLPAGLYSVKFDIPGVPMNEESDIVFELTGEDQESLEIAAVSENGKISVTRISYTATKSELVKNVTVYPNPSTGKFKVSGTGAISTIKIISHEGRIIEELSDFNKAFQEVEVDISNYPDGMYFMQIEWKDGLRSVNKLIKE